MLESCAPTIQQAFGLNFRSVGLAISELAPAQTGSDQPCKGDVEIQWGETPIELQDARQIRGLIQARHDALLLNVPSVARYLVTKDKITVTPARDADEDAVRLFLFGSAIGAALHLNGILAIHGSAVKLPQGGAAVFTGVSTAGKSTLATALGQKGYPTLADDIVAVHFDQAGRAWVYPGLSRTKLWNDALSMLNIPKAQGKQVRSDLDKYSIPLSTWGQPEPLVHLYELLPVEKGEFSMHSIKGMEKLRALDRQSFRPNFIEALGLKSAHMQRLGKLAPQIKISQIIRPRNKQTLSEIIDSLEADWA